ncbi:MAG: hypothetical protein ACW976_04270 [Candidatus Ranarchaeia archaeon]
MAHDIIFQISKQWLENIGAQILEIKKPLWIKAVHGRRYFVFSHNSSQKKKHIEISIPQIGSGDGILIEITPFDATLMKEDIQDNWEQKIITPFYIALDRIITPTDSAAEPKVDVINPTKSTQVKLLRERVTPTIYIITYPFTCRTKEKDLHFRGDVRAGITFQEQTLKEEEFAQIIKKATGKIHSLNSLTKEIANLMKKAITPKGLTIQLIAKYYKDKKPFQGTISSLIIEGSHTKPTEKKAVLQAISGISKS